MPTALASLTTAMKLLADPLRLRLCALLAGRELAVQEMVAITGLQQSRVSNHLALLKRAGLVRDRRDGTWSFHSLVEPSAAVPLTPQLFAAVIEPFQQSPGGQKDHRTLQTLLERRRQRSRAAHDQLAARWDEGFTFSVGSLRDELLARALPAAYTVADLGCGSGFLTQALAATGARVIAVDHSEQMLALARRQRGEGHIDFRLGELDALPIGDAEVDAAFANMVWHHVADLDACARELMRIVRPGGAVVISDLLPHDVEWLRQTQGDLRLGLEPEQVLAALARAGCADLHTAAAVDRCRVEPTGAPARELPMFLVHGRRPELRAPSGPFPATLT